jgi:hypothetical protein
MSSRTAGLVARPFWRRRSSRQAELHVRLFDQGSSGVKLVPHAEHTRAVAPSASGPSRRATPVTSSLPMRSCSTPSSSRMLAWPNQPEVLFSRGAIPAYEPDEVRQRSRHAQ